MQAHPLVLTAAALADSIDSGLAAAYFPGVPEMHQVRKQSTDQGPIQLAWETGKAIVVSEGQEQLLKEAQRALMASQSGLAADRFWQQFTDEFLAPIHRWCLEHGEHVDACYAPFPKDHLRVFVVRRADRYDFAINLSELEMDLFEKQWDCEVLQIPHGREELFFDPAASIQIYGNGG